MKIDRLEEQAVDAAIAQQWEKAIELNQEILSTDEENLGALLRMGYACIQVKRLEEAKKNYKMALKVQPSNHIARDNLERIKILLTKDDDIEQNDQDRIDPNMFLEIPHKTKTIALVNLGQKSDLVDLKVGKRLELKIKKRKVEVRTRSGKYIGTLPDDLSRRLMHMIERESQYEVYIKEASLSRIVVFIKEIKKGDNVQHVPSFPQNAQTPIIPVEQTDQDTSEGDEENDDDDDSSLDDPDNSLRSSQEVDDELLAYRDGQDDDDDDHER